MTHFRDFTRANGDVVTVEFTYKAGSPTTYSPLNGADGGDPCEAEIVKAFVNDCLIELPDAEREKYEEEICATTDPGDFDYDPD